MKQKLLIVCMIFLMLLPTLVSANEWTEPVYLDPFNNELFEVTEELGSDGTIISAVFEQRQAQGLYPSYYGKQAFFNDGLTRKLFDYLPDGAEETYEVSGLFDINDCLAFTPGDMEIAAASYSYDYNLGYLVEREVSFNDIEPKVYVTFTNIKTKEKYYFDTIDCDIFGNDGILIFSVGDTYYKAKLKNPAVVSVHLNGQKLYFDQIPVIQEGRTLVPVRGIFEALGAEVLWDGDTRTVTAAKGDITVSLGIDKTVATKNGEEITLDVPAKIVSGRTMVPARFVADCFGVTVEWNQDLRQVILTGNGEG